MDFGRKENDEQLINEEKKRTNIFGRAKSALINAVDQNSDGTFDLNDVSILTDSVGTAAKNAASAAKDNARQSGEQLGNWLDQTKREMELKALRPIFEEDLSSPEFVIPKMIRIVDMDKKHAESEVCEGSIGYYSEHKGINVVNIFADKTDIFDLIYYPDKENGVYYIDPCDRDRYVALEGYFNYLKVARVNELQRIAQDLGATHFKVTYKEQTTSAAENHQKASLKGKQKIQKMDEAIEVEHSQSETNSSTIEVSVDMECIGHSPTEPELKYFQKDDSINNLIRLRMSDNPVKHLKYMLFCSQSSGIKVNDAGKIDAALASMKYSMKTSISSRAQSESKRYFEYEIDF